MPASTARCTRHNRRRHQPDLSRKSPSLDPSSFLTLPSYPVASPCRPPRPPSSPSPVIVPFVFQLQPGTQDPSPPETDRNSNRTEPNPKPTLIKGAKPGTRILVLELGKGTHLMGSKPDGTASRETSEDRGSDPRDTGNPGPRVAIFDCTRDVSAGARRKRLVAAGVGAGVQHRNLGSRNCLPRVWPAFGAGVRCWSAAPVRHHPCDTWRE